MVLDTDRTQLTGLDKFRRNPTEFPNPLPLAWYHTFDHGREFYIALGHRKEMYATPLFIGIIERALLWSLRIRRF